MNPLLSEVKTQTKFVEGSKSKQKLPGARFSHASQPCLSHWSVAAEYFSRILIAMMSVAWSTMNGDEEAEERRPINGIFPTENRNKRSSAEACRGCWTQSLSWLAGWQVRVGQVPN